LSNLPTVPFYLPKKGLPPRRGKRSEDYYFTVKPEKRPAPKGSRAPRAFCFKSYPDLEAIAQKHLNMWHITFSEFMRTAVRNFIFEADDNTMLTYVMKEVNMNYELEPASSASFKAPPRFGRLLDAVVERVESLNSVLHYFENTRSLTNSDIFRTAMMWYDDFMVERYVEMKRRYDAQSI
jgi:hypothetical protein